MSQFRGFCFTINNYIEQDLRRLDQRTDYKYLILGLETGASGTPHIQGYVHWKHQKRVSTVRKIIGGHVETRKGTIQQAIDYCKKDGKFLEFGDIPQEAATTSKVRWDELVSKAEQGDFDWIKENHPQQWVCLSDKLQGLHERKGKILQGLSRHEWWVGPTGTGKSKTVWDLYPEHFQKELNKWWCNYKDEDVVVIEEWSPKNECTASQLKVWADRYPFTGQVKGANLRKIRPKKIIVLSNYTIEQCFTDPRDQEPLLRRFTTIDFSDGIEGALQAQAIKELEETEDSDDREVMDQVQAITSPPGQPLLQRQDATDGVAVDWMNWNWDTCQANTLLDDLML